MNYLLDTHTFLWAVFAPDKLSAKAKSAIRSTKNRIFISTISFWEISLKFALGNIQLESCTPDALPDVAVQMCIEIIQPTAQPKDAFGRMIIWQAIQQPLSLI